QAVSEYPGGELVGKLDIVQRHLHVLDHPIHRLGGLHLTLVLVQERDGFDQREILLVIAPSARRSIEEGELLGIGVHDRERSQQPLRILMDLYPSIALLTLDESGECASLALQLMDGAGLL